MNEIKQTDEMEILINFINELVSEEYVLEKDGVKGSFYFTHGGCYDFYKIIKNYVPEITCLIQKDLNHCCFKYRNKVYDANGIREDIDNFEIANEEDMLYMDRAFGLNIKSLHPKRIVNEIDQCNINHIIHRLS